MKKFSVIILLGLLMAGCSGAKVEEADKQLHYTSVDSMSYYQQNVEANLAIKELEKEIEEYFMNDQDSLVNIQYYYDYESDYCPIVCMNYSFLNIDKKAKLLINNPIMQKIEEEFMPDVNTFVQSVCSEEENLAPQAIVINNNWMIMCPNQLYTAAYSIIGSPVTVGLNAFEIKDNYLKELVKGIDTQRFVVHEPLIVDEGAVLQFSTPFYLNDVEVVNEEGDENRSWHGNPNMSLRLYIHQGAVEEIHAIIKLPDENRVETEDLQPILVWAKDEWQVDEPTLKSLQELIDSIASGTLTKQKGKAGSCDYIYNVQRRKYNRGIIMELTLKPNL